MTKQSVWTLAELDHKGELDPVSFEMTARAQNLDAAIHVLLFAPEGVSDETLAPLFHHGADEVLLLENDAFTFFQADVWGRLFADVARNPPGKIEKAKLREKYCGVRLVEAATTD